MFLWTCFVTIGTKFPVLNVWPATYIKGLIFRVVHMYFALASNRTQTFVVDFRGNSMTRVRKNYVQSYSINNQHFLHPL